MKYFTLNDDNREEAIRAAGSALKDGGVVIFPTDTVYGIAAHPDFPKAIERIREIKGRDENKPIAFLASSCDSPYGFGAVMPEQAKRIAKAFWPGALTLVLECNGIEEGFRVPDFAIAREVIEIAGGLLRVTSANLSSTPSLDEITEAMRPVFEKCDVVIDAGRCPGGVHSTVVRVTPDNCVKILRQGAIDITPCLMR